MLQEKDNLEVTMQSSQMRDDLKHKLSEMKSLIDQQRQMQNDLVDRLKVSDKHVPSQPNN